MHIIRLKGLFIIANINLKKKKQLTEDEVHKHFKIGTAPEFLKLLDSKK